MYIYIRVYVCLCAPSVALSVPEFSVLKDPCTFNNKQLKIIVNADDIAPSFQNMLMRNCMFFPQEVAYCRRPLPLPSPAPFPLYSAPFRTCLGWMQRLECISSSSLTRFTFSQDKFELKFNGNITVVNQVQSLYQEISEFVSCRNSTIDSDRYTSPEPNPCYPRPT